MAVLRRSHLLAATLAWSVLSGPSPAAQTALSTTASAPSEYDVKAAFLLRFTEFVTWPGLDRAGREHLVVGILGDSPLAEHLEKVVAGLPPERRVTLHRWGTLSDVAGPVHVLFVCESEAPDLAQIVATMHAEHTLTVADTPGFGERGVVINFRNERGRVRFDINVARAEQAGLEISSQLLKLARILRSALPALELLEILAGWRGQGGTPGPGTSVAA